MKKFSLIIIVTLLCPIYLSAQRLLAKIPISNSGEIENVQGFVLGDSMFFSYEFSRSMDLSLKNAHSVIIKPDGLIQELEIPELYQKPLFSVTNDSDSMFFNFFEQEKRAIHLKAIALCKRNGEKSLVKNVSVISESILGSFYENGYNIVTINQHDSTLNFNQIIKNSLITISKYKLPSTLFKKNGDNSIAFIKEGDRILGSSAVAAIKIYCTSKEIIVVEKILTVHVDNKGTIVTRINRITGESKSKFFKQPLTGIFNSFFIGEDLFWVKKDNGLHIIVSNWSQNLNSEYVIDKKTSYVNEMTMSGLKPYTVWDAIKIGDEAFIAAYPNRDGSIYLKTGTNEVIKLGAVPILPGFGALTYALALTSLATKAVDEGFSLDYFFYLKKDSTGFSYTKSPVIIEQIIYSYQTDDIKNIVNKFKYIYSDYFKSPYGITGVFVKNVEPREFEIVKFYYPQQ